MTNNKRIMLWCGLSLLVSLIINSFDTYAHCQAVSANGSRDMLWSIMILVVPFLAILFVLIPASLIGLIFEFPRKICFVMLLCSIVYIGTASICFRLSDKLRIAAFHELANRSEPLVQAIKNYELQYGSPPASLESLIPDFLPNIPQTGMGAYPEYEYKVGEEAQDFTKEEWCLVVQTPTGGLNWDMFIYFPSQDYAELGEAYGGFPEKVGDWAYIYE